MMYTSLTETKLLDRGLAEAPADYLVRSEAPGNGPHDSTSEAGAAANAPSANDLVGTDFVDAHNAVAGALPNGHARLSEARQIHEELKDLHACGNEVHLAKIERLRVVHDCGMCYELGYSSYPQYCDREFGLARSTAFESVRVAEAFDKLPQLRRLFKEGELSWTQVRAITRVATAETEPRWIELAWTEPVLVLRAEVSEAQRTGRTTPRDRRHGLPNLLVDLGIKVTLEEKARVLAAFGLVEAALDDDSAGDGAGVEGAAADDADADGTSVGDIPNAENGRLPLVRWADAVLAGRIPVEPCDGDSEAVDVDAEFGDRAKGDASADDYATGIGSTDGGETSRSGRAARRAAARLRRKRRARAQTIVYHVCPACRESTVETPSGRVSVAPERIAQLKSDAKRVELEQDEVVEPGELRSGTGAVDPSDGVASSERGNGAIDAPNSARLRRQVLHRDGLKCANPACGRKGDLQAHHIVYRSRGGMTALCNEVAVCSTCHALIHSGRLEVKGTYLDGLAWTPRPADPATRVRCASDMRARARALMDSCAAAENGRRARGEACAGQSHIRAIGHTNRASPQSPVETAITPERFEDLVYGLHRLGYTIKGAKEHLGRVIVELLADAQAKHASGGPPPEPLTDEQIMMGALRGRGGDATRR